MLSKTVLTVSIRYRRSIGGSQTVIPVSRYWRSTGPRYRPPRPIQKAGDSGWIGDFEGDGTSQITGRALSIGQWWTGLKRKLCGAIGKEDRY